MKSGDTAPGLGSVIMDGLTLQSALRILGEDGAVQAPAAHEFRNDKWDYDLNLALRVAMDVECLAQLVHAIVMHEEIGISPGFVHLTGGLMIMRDGYGSFVPPAAGEGLGGVVTPLTYPESLHRQMLLRAGEQALEISRTPEFRHYLRALSSGGLEGVILDISNGYFETGYSDPSALASFELEEENDREAIYVDLSLDEMAQATVLLRRAKLAMGPAKKKSLTAEAQAHMATGQRYHLLAEAMRSIDNRDHALIEAPIPSGYGYDKMTAAYDVVRNMAAALYFQYLAQLADAPYLPHVLRAPLVTFDSGVSPSTPSANLEQRVIGHLQTLRRRRADSITAMIGDPGFDLEVPLVLAKILKDARGPAEVIPRALELRETASARRLRSWFRDLHAQLHAPEADMRSVERELEGFRALISRWTGSTMSDGEAAVTMGVNLGVVYFESPLPSGLGKVRRRWRLQFLYDLARAGDATPRLAPALAKVFGEPIGQAWQQAQHTIERFTSMHGSPGDRESLLDLR
jgi:hypothetical protein